MGQVYSLASRDNDIEGIVELTFSIDDEKFGERDTIDLKPDGRNIPVTNENKHEYVEYVYKPCSSFSCLLGRDLVV